MAHKNFFARLVSEASWRLKICRWILWNHSTIQPFNHLTIKLNPWQRKQQLRCKVQVITLITKMYYVFELISIRTHVCMDNAALTWVWKISEHLLAQWNGLVSWLWFHSWVTRLAHQKDRRLWRWSFCLTTTFLNIENNCGRLVIMPSQCVQHKVQSQYSPR